MHSGSSSGSRLPEAAQEQGREEETKPRVGHVGVHGPAVTEKNKQWQRPGHLPQDELAVLQRRAWAAPLLQEAHLLVEGQVEAPRPKTVPRKLEPQQGGKAPRPGALSSSVSSLCLLASSACPVWPNQHECSRMFLCLQRAMLCLLFTIM